MLVRLPVLAAGGTLLVVLSLFTPYVAAQTPSPALKTLYEFTGAPNGGIPQRA